MEKFASRQAHCGFCLFVAYSLQWNDFDTLLVRNRWSPRQVPMQTV